MWVSTLSGFVIKVCLCNLLLGFDVSSLTYLLRMREELPVVVPLPEAMSVRVWKPRRESGVFEGLNV